MSSSLLLFVSQLIVSFKRFLYSYFSMFTFVFLACIVPSNSPRVCLPPSVRTRGPWLEVIEGHTPVKCCCSRHRTPASPQLCAIVHLHINTHTHVRKDSEAREMARNSLDLSLADKNRVDCSPIYCHSRSTLTRLAIHCSDT